MVHVRMKNQILINVAIPGNLLAIFRPLSETISRSVTEKYQPTAFVNTTLIRKPIAHLFPIITSVNTGKTFTTGIQCYVTIW